MNKTLVLVEIEHSRPLPADVTDSIANKLWITLHNKDVPCEISATLWGNQPTPDKRWMEVQ